MSTPPLTIQLFGPFHVQVHGETMPRLRTRSVEWLLALLVLKHGRSVERSYLAGTLWPDSEESRALSNLRDALVHLRKALGPEKERLQSPTKDTLTLDLTGAEADVVGFDRAVKTGEEAALRKAIESYRGPLLEECAEEWVVLERNTREQATLNALETLAAAAEQRRDYADALTFLRRAQHLDALRDTVQRRLMRVLEASGDAPAALLAYRDYRLRLQEAMNLEPDAETIRLYQQIRAQARQSAQQRGEVRSQKSEDSRQKSEVRSEESVSPTPYSLLPAPCSLPHPLTALIGREQETGDIIEALSQSRLVTLVGGGGVGKTRLSIQAAREISPQFADGAVFVALASLSDPALLPAFVASALGMREEAASEPEFLTHALTGWLSTHEVLLVLDNCEHLLEAAAALTQTLLERCPDLHILATSRQRLGLTGEIVWRVPSLPFPAPEPLSRDTESAVEMVQASPAGQLFVERAAMARPGFRLDGQEDALAVAHICRRLDGIPLAIELAAARIGLLTARQIAARLDDRFRLLARSNKSVMTRHQTLRALIDWSYALLTEEERTLLCLLSVFAGGWTLESAEAVAETDILEALASLLDQSLVLSEEREDDVRYRMLETVREYSREKLRESGDERSARNRHLSYYLDQAQTFAPALRGDSPEAAVHGLESEVDNVRAALAWAQELAPDSDAYLQLTAALWPFWEIRGYLTEGRAHLRTALNLCGQTDETSRAQALLGAARLAVMQCDMGEASVFGQECLAWFRKREDARGIAEALLNLGEMHYVQWQKDQAVALLEEGREYSRQSAWTQGVAHSAVQLGMIFMERQEAVRARALLEEGLELAGATGNQRLMARAYRNLGILATEEGDYCGGLQVLEKSLLLRQKLGERAGAAASLGCLAQLELQLGDKARAAVYCQEEMAIFRELGNPDGVAHALHRMGQIRFLQEEYEAAYQAYSGALENFLLFHEAPPGYILMSLGCTLFHLGNGAEARKRHQEALPHYLRDQNINGIFWAMDRIGMAQALCGDARKAAQILGSASVIRDALGLQPSWDQADREKAVAAIRAALDEKEFTALWEEGRAWTQEQAIEFALQVEQTIPS